MQLTELVDFIAEDWDEQAANCLGDKKQKDGYKWGRCRRWLPLLAHVSQHYSRY